MLFRLGHGAARRPWLVVGVWLMLAVLAGVGAKVSGGTTRDSFSIPGAPSNEALQLFFTNAPALAAPGAVAVFHTPDGQVTDPTHKAAIEEALANLGHVPSVSSVSDPFQVNAALQAMDHGQPLSTPIPGTDISLDRLLASPISNDGRYLMANLVFTSDLAAVPADVVDQMHEAVRPATAAGVQTAFGGQVVDARNAEHGGLSAHADEIGLVLAVIILLVALGSVTGMAVPLLNALFSLAVSSLLVVMLEARFEIGSIAPIIATTIGLGVGIDYSLFIVSRFRQNLGQGMEPPAAVGNAIATSGSSVLFAAITVCIALVGLFVIGIPYITWLGVVAALYVAVTVVSALTLLPAILGLLGRRIDALRLPWHKPAEEDTDEAMKATFSARWAAAVARRPVLFTVVSLVVLLALAYPLLRIDLGMPDDASAPAGSTQRIAFDQQTEAFGPGSTGPLLLVVKLSANGAAPPTTTTSTTVPTSASTPGTATNVSAACGAGSATAVATTPPEEQALLALGGALLKTPGVTRVTPVGVCGDVFVLAVTPSTGPSSAATLDLVHHLRDSVIPEALAGTAISPSAVFVGGQTAILIDLVAQVQARILWFIAMVLVLAFVLLAMVFRSLYVPLNAAVMNLLSIGAALGLLVAVFQLGWGASLLGVNQKIAIVAVVPVMMFAVLFGLSMDYEVFLLSRIREEYDRTGDSAEAVVAGLGHTARVITAAALIMISVFGFSAVNPSAAVKMIGFGMAAAVLIDATIVRMMLVPASMELVGKACWWFPSWLDRILPRISLEGGTEAKGE